MMPTKKTTTLIVIAAFVLTAIAATSPPGRTHRNLKVLPNNISDHQLDSIMDTYNKALKVSCDFCHSKAKNMLLLNTASDELDFAADNEMKEQGRRMMRMTIDINKTYFKFDTTGRPDHLLNVVTCNTCHRGNPFPANE